MRFNKKRYLELLRYKEKLKKENKSLHDISESDFRELSSYSAEMSTRLELELSNGYLSLLEEFLNNKIDAGELAQQYRELQDWQDTIHDELTSKLIILSPSEYSIFDLSEDLYWTLEEMAITTKEEAFEAIIQEEDYETALRRIKDRNIYDTIKRIYLQVQNIVEDYRTHSNLSKDLSQLVDQLNWENQDQYFDLINEFLNESSNFLNLKERYQSILKVANDLESKSIALKLNYQALGFSNYILILIQLFDFYNIDSSISPKVFKSWIRTILFQMKNHYS